MLGTIAYNLPCTKIFVNERNPEDRFREPRTFTPTSDMTQMDDQRVAREPQPDGHESSGRARKPNRFTHRELDIMSVLWRQGSGTVAEVRDVLGEEVGYTTVLKMLQILEGKNAVRHEKEGRAHRYYPLVESADAGGSALRRVMSKIFHGSAELLLATLVENREFSDEEIARMRSILDRASTREEGR